MSKRKAMELIVSLRLSRALVEKIDAEAVQLESEVMPGLLAFDRSKAARVLIELGLEVSAERRKARARMGKLRARRDRATTARA